MARERERFTDSAGLTVEYTPIEELEPGMTVVLGWRTVVERVEVEATRARVWWRGGNHPDQWNSLGSQMPVEVPDAS